MAFDLASARPVEDETRIPATPVAVKPQPLLRPGTRMDTGFAVETATPSATVAQPLAGGFDPASALPAQARRVATFDNPQAGPAESVVRFLAPAGSVRQGLAMGFVDPIDAGAQLLPRALGAITSLFGLAPNRVSNFLDSEAARVDNIVRDRNSAYESERAAEALPSTEKPGFDLARLAGNVANPATWLGGAPTKGAGLLQLAGAGAKAGAVSGAMQPVLDTDSFWTEKAKQTAMGAGTGAIATPAIVKGTTAAVDLAGKARAALANRVPQAVDPQQVRIAVTNTITSQGMRPGDLPEVVLKAVERDVLKAMQTGSKVDPAAILRKAEFEAVGLAGDTGPTVGQLTRDTNPMNFANEKNMSGIVLDRGQRGMGNDLADRFQNQNKGLQALFDNAGASGAMDKGTAGKQIIDALKAADAPVKQGVDDLYAAARAMTGGRQVELERGTFTQAANKALDEGMWGRFVPDNIRGLLNDITSGKTPFTVDAEVQIDGILSAAQRKAGKGSPEWSAIGVIRDALRNTPIAQPAAAADDLAGAAARAADDGVTDVAARMAQPGALPNPQPKLAGPGPANAITDLRPVQPPPRAAVPPVDEGAAAREAFAQARMAARKRFATIDDTPALKAALEGDAPDDFVRNFVLNADARDLAAMKKVLDASPEAKDQARAQIAEHLKRAAFGENPSGDKAFTSDRYLKAVRAIGKQNLEVFFTPAELVKLNLAGKVASDINSIPAGAKYGTNTSGTAAAVMNLLSKFGAKMADAVPVIGPTAKAVVGAVGDKLGAVKTQAAIDKAINPVAERVNTGAISQAAQRLIQAPAPAIGVAAGAAASAGATSPPDMDRARAIRADFRAGRIDKAEAIKRLNALGIE